ncbi:thioredoxin domain-containing protein [Sulfurospirillum sp. 1307]|jgi:uncharacterized protein YyaL (SSP411 family)
MKFLIFFIYFTTLFASNSLINSHSPYLLSHADNPVNWYAWSDKSLDLAKKQNKLIFLSIGYSTCHWCHVMEEESFEDEQIAKLLNDNYISIKVDKEEMPHIDSHFQDLLVKIKSQRKGWPLSAILTPNQKILYITTYIPKTDNYGVKGMDYILPKYANIWQYKKELVKKIIHENEISIDKEKSIANNNISDISKTYVKEALNRFDKIYYGFDKSPKFPLPTHLNTLVDIYLLDNNKEAFDMVFKTADSISYGGIYDQVEGGFFRYSTYADWIIPHFEKMLYTQAELVKLYVKLYIVKPKEKYKEIVLSTIYLVQKRFKNKDDLYFSALDADNKLGEGMYYLYDYTKVKNEFIKANINNYEELMEYMDINEIGNFEDSLSNVQFNTGFDYEPKNLKKALKILRDLRKDRDFPFIDKKIITSWNALMIKALFKASYFDKTLSLKAEKSMLKLLQKVYINGNLYHGFLNNHKPKVKAYLEDYVFLIDLLQTSYMYTYNKAYLKLSKYILDECLSKFYKGGKFFLDDTKFKSLATYEDKYYVSALSTLFHVMFTQANLNYDLKLLKKTRDLLKAQKNAILNVPFDAPNGVLALIRSKNRDIVLKSNKNNLIKYQDEISTIRYPFLLRSVENIDKYLACDEKSCFAIDEKLSDIEKQIIAY